MDVKINPEGIGVRVSFSPEAVQKIVEEYDQPEKKAERETKRFAERDKYWKDTTHPVKWTMCGSCLERHWCVQSCEWDRPTCEPCDDDDIWDLLYD